MRLHRLQITAIGPFAEQQDVDFDRLADAGLFLFEGPTGVGKTTVLDAITFALYGSLAGAGADESRLHSHFAADTTPTVTLDFSVAGTRYRITRIPKHQRSKQRGSGTTTARAHAQLARLGADGWDPIADKPADVGPRITALLGLSCEQFRQVVLLPQGEFARFLHANDDNRRDVLTRMFGAERYERITDQLDADATAARKRAREAEDDIRQRLAALLEAHAVGDEQAASMHEVIRPWTPEAAQVLRRQASALSDALDVESGAARSALAEAAAAASDAALQRHAATTLRDRLQMLVKLRRQRAALAAEAAQRDAEHAELQAAERAAGVAGLLAAAATADRELERCWADVIALDPDADRDHPGDAGELRREAAAATATAAGLQHLVTLERRLPGDIAARDALLQQRADAEEQRSRDQHRYDELPARIDAVTQALEPARIRAAQSPLLDQQLRAAGDRLQAAQDLEALTPRIAAAEDRRRDAVDTSQAARQAELDVAQRRIDGMTAALAAQLQPGDPCAVCGSREHPAPAPATAQPVSDADLEAARDTFRQAEARRTAAEQAVTRVQFDLAQLRERAGNLDAAAAREAVDRLTAQQHDAHAAELEVREHEQRLTDLTDEQRQLADRLREHDTVQAALARDVESLLGRIAEAERALSAERGGHATVAERVAALYDAATRDERLADALAAAAQHRDRAAQVREEATGLALRQGFADLAQARAAVRDDSRCAQLRASGEEYRHHVAHMDELLAGMADLDPDGLDAAEVAAAAADDRAAHATAAAKAAQSAVDRLDHRVARVVTCSAKLEDALAARETVARDDEALLELADLVRGQSGLRRMTLTTYVLRYWFDQVVQAANARLRGIAAGRYELRRTEDGARADARVGLGLVVSDAYTGQVRGTGSLSGGETFYTSLALALGLADVVQAEAGGTVLDTLFIDEGFGSLDPDTLDEVLTVIDSLRGNGRTVGIVSHVSELKDRIQERLEVRRVRADGPSQLRVVA